MALKYCQSNAQQLFICAPYDTVGDQPVTLLGKFAIVSKRAGRGSKIDEQGGLPDGVILEIGLKVMVTFNIETDLDVRANETRGEVIKIVLDKNKSNYSLKYPPVYVLIRMKSSRVSSIEGLEQNIIPLMPMEHTYHPGISEQDCCSQTTSAEDERLARNEETENWWNGFRVPNFA